MAKSIELEAQIRREIAVQVVKFAEMGIPEEERMAMYFQNFHLNLPYGGRQNNLQKYLDDPRMSKQNGKSLRQFYIDVNATTTEIGVGVEIRRLQLNSRDLAVRNQLFEVAFPVYVALRGKSYTHRDLTQ